MTKKCELCGKTFKKNTIFGLSCLKKISLQMGLDNVRSYKDESLLNEEICNRLNKRGLSDAQKELLTNRYYTFELLSKININEYDKYKKLVENDIKKINERTVKSELKSFNKISLKNANEINKHYQKHKSIFQKIENGDYDAIQEISINVINFAFNKYYTKKPYLSDMIQVLQLFILKCFGETFLKINHYDFAAKCLNHALKKEPNDLIITDEKIVTKIKNEKIFKTTIKNTLKENISNTEFYKICIINFEDGDLFNALHAATLIVKGKRNNDKWNLNITIKDKYDFTEFIKIQDYDSENNSISRIPASIGNNIALIATNCNVVHTYNIIIKFSIIL